MSAVRFTLTGEGRVEIPGYGIADAEDRLEKEIRAVFPDALIRLLQTRRTDPEPRIVEQFEIEYRVVVAVEVDAEAGDAEKMRRRAFASAREMVSGSRIEKIQWMKGEPSR